MKLVIKKILNIFIITGLLVSLICFIRSIYNLVYNQQVHIVCQLAYIVFVFLITIFIGLIIYSILSLKFYNIIKSPIHYLWIKRTLFYLITCLLTVFLSYFILFNFNLLHTQVDSAQYMISALIQGEAAIIAIIITLSLIAVQLSASSYSTRVIDLFKYGNPDFWIILITYVGLITYGLGLLKLIEGPSSSISNHEISIIILYSFSIFSLIALIPYLWNTLDLLKPLRITELLVNKISIENLSSAVGHRQLDPHSNPILEWISYIFLFSIEKKKIDDPIQPVFDILTRSLINHDYETTRQGFELIQQSTNNIIESNYDNNSVFSLILDKIAIDFTSFTKFVIIKKEEDLILKSIKILHDIEEVAYIRNMKNVIITIVEAFDQIETLAAKQNIRSIEIDALKSLKQIRDKCNYFMWDELELKVCEKLIEKNKEDIISLSNKAFIDRINSRYEEALNAYNKILYITPNDTKILHEKAMILIKTNRGEEALIEFDKLLKINPDDFEALSMKGHVLLFTLHRYEEALVAYHKAIDLNPLEARIWEELGITFHHLGKHEEAQESFKKAEELD